MTRREKILQLLSQAVLIAVTVLAARYGITIPPPVIDGDSIRSVMPNEPQPFAVPPNGPKMVPDPTPAIGRLTVGGNGCTATVIGPQRDDGRWLVLSAAHCVNKVGQSGTLRLPSGRTIPVAVATINKRADCAWLVTVEPIADLPNAILAADVPAKGSEVWHAGFGVDRPGNREVGQFVEGPNGDGQIQFRLSVSSGDSGGAIVIAKTGEVVSTVCCTSARGQLADVWGAGPAAIAGAKPGTPVAEQWVPMLIPQRKPDGE
jgi:hypothetical protein